MRVVARKNASDCLALRVWVESTEGQGTTFAFLEILLRYAWAWLILDDPYLDIVNGLLVEGEKVPAGKPLTLVSSSFVVSMLQFRHQPVKVILEHRENIIKVLIHR